MGEMESKRLIGAREKGVNAVSGRQAALEV